LPKFFGLRTDSYPCNTLSGHRSCDAKAEHR
jgi:hypothetical protein